jgi:hypothetical protein
MKTMKSMKLMKLMNQLIKPYIHSIIFFGIGISYGLIFSHIGIELYNFTKKYLTIS